MKFYDIISSNQRMGEINLKSFEIGKNDAGQRMDKFLSKAAPSLPKSLLYKYLRTKRIKLNGKRAEPASRLNEGDIVELYINDEFFARKEYHYDFLKAPKKPDILYEDENILIINKPPGVLCHPDGDNYTNNLIASVRRYLFEKGEYDPEKENSFAPALANRIDRNTGGLVMAAKNAEALRILNDRIKNREITKKYLCVAEGAFKEKSGVLEGFISLNKSQNKATVTKKETEDSKAIKTGYTVLKEKNGLSLLEIELFTGRTHQIRAQFAAIGHPLYGDTKYKGKAAGENSPYKKQYLYAYKLEFSFKTDAGALNYLKDKVFTAPEPEFVAEFNNGKLK